MSRGGLPWVGWPSRLNTVHFNSCVAMAWCEQSTVMRTWSPVTLIWTVNSSHQDIAEQWQTKKTSKSSCSDRLSISRSWGFFAKCQNTLEFTIGSPKESHFCLPRIVLLQTWVTSSLKLVLNLGNRPSSSHTASISINSPRRPQSWWKFSCGFRSSRIAESTSYKRDRVLEQGMVVLDRLCTTVWRACHRCRVDISACSFWG